MSWTNGKTLPPEEGWYLCYARIPTKAHGSQSRSGHYRYLVLEFSEGVFWVMRGAPDNFVLFWAPLLAPPGELVPEMLGRKAKRLATNKLDHEEITT